MTNRLTIGQFARMTYLSATTLRHYHAVGLLEPAGVDPVTGYRSYTVDQVAMAHVVRRLRDLDMPIDDVRDVLAARDAADRNRVILQHLDRMRRQLERTQHSVESLQALLEGDTEERADIELRRIPATPAVVARRVVGFDNCAGWLEAALVDLHSELDRAGLAVAGSDGAIYPDEFFQAGEGEVTAYVPVIGHGEAVDLPATTVAVLVHDGPFTDLDQTYGALGTIVAERGIGAPGPIREHYLTATSTEVCWPVRIGPDR